VIVNGKRLRHASEFGVVLVGSVDDARLRVPSANSSASSPTSSCVSLENGHDPHDERRELLSDVRERLQNEEVDGVEVE